MLNLTLLGGLQIQVDELPPAQFVSQRAALMVVYLTLTGKSIRREALATFLWDDRTQAQSLANLRSLLARIPQEVKACLSIDRSTVRLAKTAVVQSDATRCLSAIEQALSVWDIQALESALTLYQGPFLDGIIVDDSEGLDHWIRTERERIHQVVITGYEQLCVAFLKNRALDKGIVCAKQLIQLDELRERPYQLLMELYGRRGERERGLHVFNQCQAMLNQDFGIGPSLPVIKLAERLRRQTRPPLHAVPQAVTPFIGQEALLSRLVSVLTNEERLLSLVGYGGVGKTRLAIALARRLERQFWDGIVFIDLSGTAVTDDPKRSVMYQTAVSLALLPQEGVALEQQILNFLREKEILLIFDNFEPFISSSASLLSTILQQTAGTKLVVTSRERLHLRAEMVFTIRGLSYPTDATLPDGVDSDALQLFEACAKRTGEQFSLHKTSPYLGEIVKICQILEGNPLGIEIIATAMTIAEIPHIQEKITPSLTTITASQSDYPRRHKSLAAVFDYSWNLLTKDEQTALAHFSIVLGPVESTILNQIVTVPELTWERLTDKSLLINDRALFSLHPLVREFAQQRRVDMLTQAEEYILWERYTTVYLAQAIEIQEKIEAGLPLETRDRLTHRLANIRIAWEWAASHYSPQLLASHAPAILGLYTQFNLAQEGLEVTLNILMRLGESTEHPAERAMFILSQVSFLGHLERYETISPLVEMEIRLAQKGNDDELVASFLLEKARQLEIQGQLDEAKQCLEQVSTICRRKQRARLLSLARYGLGNIYRRQSLNQEALQLFQEALNASTQEAVAKDKAMILGDMGIVYTEMSDYESAIRCHEVALVFAQTIHHEAEIAKRSNNIGLLYWKLNQLDAALERYQTALALAEKLGIYRGIGIAATNVAIIYKSKEAYYQALSIYEYAYDASRKAGDVQTAVMCLGNIGTVYKALGNYEQAASYYEKALELDEGRAYPATLARHLGQLAELADLQRKVSQAHDYFHQALPLMTTYGSPYDQCWFWITRARFLFNQGRWAEAGEMNERGRILAYQIKHAPVIFAGEVLKAKLLFSQGHLNAGRQALKQLDEVYPEPHCQAITHLELWAMGEADFYETAVSLNRTLYQKTKGIHYWDALRQLTPDA